MKPGGHNSKWLAAAALAFAVAIPGLCFSQKTASTSDQKDKSPAYQQHFLPPRGHVGDWLRRYKDLPPEEQERALKSDPDFQRLSPEKQQRFLRRLQSFSNLSPEQQLNELNRMETWEHLTPEQKKQALKLFGQLRELPPDRRRQVRSAINDLRTKPQDQREKEIESAPFKENFSDQERDLMREATRLPLAPATTVDVELQDQQPENDGTGPR